MNYLINIVVVGKGNQYAHRQKRIGNEKKSKNQMLNNKTRR